MITGRIYLPNAVIIQKNYYLLQKNILRCLETSQGRPYLGGSQRWPFSGGVSGTSVSGGFSTMAFSGCVSGTTFSVGDDCVWGLLGEGPFWRRLGDVLLYWRLEDDLSKKFSAMTLSGGVSETIVSGVFSGTTFSTGMLVSTVLVHDDLTNFPFGHVCTSNYPSGHVNWND